METGTQEKGTRERGRLLLDRKETDTTHGQMAVYKGKRGNPVLG